MIKIISALISMIYISMAQDSSVKAHLNLVIDGVKTEMMLPFPYLPQEYEKTLQITKVFISQGTWGYTEPGLVYLTGTLSPCVGLVAKYQTPEESPRILIAHLDHLADIKTLILPILKLSGNQEFIAALLSIQLFSQRIDGYDQKSSEYQGHSWQDLHHGKTQFDHIKNLKDVLCCILKIERSQVRAQLFTNTVSLQNMGKYIAVTNQLAILPDGTIYTVSHFFSDPFMAKTSPESQSNPIAFFKEEHTKITELVCFIGNKRFEANSIEFDIMAYGKIPLMNIHDIQS